MFIVCAYLKILPRVGNTAPHPPLGFVPGWADLLPQPGVGDATPAVLVALLMFAVPLGPGGTPLLTWNLVQVHFYITFT